MKIKFISALFFVALLSSCGGDGDKKVETSDKHATEAPKTEAKAIDPKEDKGVGPISSVTIGEIDNTMAEAGKKIFKAKCSACHKMAKRFVGPALQGITEKRTPEWIMNMILDPEKMVSENAAAKQLLMEYSAPMANQNLTEEEARSVLEYFRTEI